MLNIEEVIIIKKLDILIIASFVSNLFYSISYAVIHLYLVEGISSNIMSLCALLGCVFTVIVTKLWLKYSEVLYKYFVKFLLVEPLLYSIIIILILRGIISSQLYYILDSMLFSIITRNIMCGGNRLKSLRYSNEDREIFDNKQNYWSNISSILGFGFSSVFKLNITIAFILVFISVFIDNIFYYIAYKSTRKIY